MDTRDFCTFYKIDALGRFALDEKQETKFVGTMLADYDDKSGSAFVICTVYIAEACNHMSPIP